MSTQRDSYQVSLGGLKRGKEVCGANVCVCMCVYACMHMMHVQI